MSQYETFTDYVTDDLLGKRQEFFFLHHCYVQTVTASDAASNKMGLKRLEYGYKNTPSCSALILKRGNRGTNVLVANGLILMKISYKRIINCTKAVE
jgi:hypothetical protein